MMNPKCLTGLKGIETSLRSEEEIAMEPNERRTLQFGQFTLVEGDDEDDEVAEMPVKMVNNAKDKDKATD